jgi:hypothetical protein
MSALALGSVACGERAGAPTALPSAASASPTAQVAASAVAVDNALVVYLRGAEVQAETDAQRRELRRALADLLERPAAEWAARRYAGARGEPGQRDMVQVLRAHLLPAAPLSLDTDDLKASAGQPAARAALRELVDRLDRDLAAAPPAPAATPRAAASASAARRGVP